jgi:NDP-sugar pyrophosphorylase family protein
MLPVAILAGGLGTRLRPLTEVVPKSMIEICGKPFAHWQTKLLARSGVTEIVYCVSYKSQEIQKFLGDGSQYGVKINFSHDGPKQLGTGGAIAKALPLLGKKFMVLYGDSYLPIDFSKVGHAFEECGKPALMTVYHNKGNFDSSNADFTDGVLSRYQKGVSDPRMTYIDYGLSCFEQSVFSDCATDCATDLAEICMALSSKNLLEGYEVEERFYEIGSAQGILDLSAFVERNLDEL